MGSITPSTPALAEKWDVEFKPPTESLCVLLSRAATQYSDHDAVISLHPPQRWTFAQLHRASLRFAARLSSTGVTAGSSVVAILFNQAEWAVVFWASAYLGCRFIPLDPRTVAHPEDAGYLLNQADPAVIVVATEVIAAQIDAVLPEHQKSPTLCYIVSENPSGSVREGWLNLFQEREESRGDDTPSPLASPKSVESPAVLLFTSGTTSRPKACPLTSTNLCAPALQVMESFELRPGHNLCQHLPAFHIFGIVFILASFFAGATVVFPSSGFDVASSIEVIESRQNVHVPCVPLMAQAIASHPSVPIGGWKSLNSISLGGAPAFLEVIEACRRLGPKKLCVGYGLTEGVVTLINLKDTNDWASGTGDISSGIVCSGSRMKICAPGSRTPLYRGQVGELHQGGLPVFAGYLGVNNESCYRENEVNWIATGDQAYMDEEGYVYIFGRYKDIIIRGGENISPAKIENCLRKVPGVEAQVIGIPDELAGEVPIAIVQQKGPSRFSSKELKGKALSDLGPGFSPVMVLDLQLDLKKDTYPITTSGKVQKSALRDWVLEYLKAITTDSPDIHNVWTVETQLLSIWAASSGQKIVDIDPMASIHTFADSMVLIRFTSQVRKQLHRNITTRDLVECNTINKIASLLNSLPITTNDSLAQKTRHSKESTTSAMVHAHGSEDRIRTTKQLATSHLAPLGLGWDDVEEVIPVSDCMKLMTQRGRMNSWNHRHSLVVRSRSKAEVTDILQLWLKRNDLLRSTAVKFDDDLELYLVMRPREIWFKHQLLDGREIASVDETVTYRLNDLGYDHVHPSGPLMKATIMSIRDSSAVGVVLHLHHVMFDGLVLGQWYEDLKRLFHDKTAPSLLRPFGDFAAMSYLHRDGPAAQRAVDFHVKRLRGISRMQNEFWPPQRAPRWFKGDDQEWWYEDQSPGQPGDRVPLDGDQSCGTMGLSYTIRLPHILQLKSKREISPPIVAKSACAMFNLHRTGAEEAVFVSDESGRSWPFVEEDASMFPSVNPLDIGGPTFTKTVNRIRVEPGETTLEFLMRMKEDQRDIDRHCHAPLGAIYRRLAQDTVCGLADVAAVKDILQRQLFDWLPTFPSSESTATEQAGQFEMLEVLSRSDLGIVWFPNLLDNDTLVLGASWDDAQLRASEICEAIREFLCAMAWMTDPANLDKPVMECEFGGHQVRAVEENINCHR